MKKGKTSCGNFAGLQNLATCKVRRLRIFVTYEPVNFRRLRIFATCEISRIFAGYEFSQHCSPVLTAL